MAEIPNVSYLSTQVALMLSERLGREIKYPTLLQLIRNRHIEAPPKDASDTYRWLPEHVEAAYTVLAARRPRIKSK